jgi:threonine dehydrogenase-like Zn-dependent dehydrogenase
MPFSTEDAFARELTVRFLVGNPIGVREELLRLVTAQQLSPASIISDALPLAAASDAYRLFDGREAIKVTLAP